MLLMSGQQRSIDMSILKSFADSVGDLLGTSKLAKYNRNVFKPILGTNITRKEYNQSLRGTISPGELFGDAKTVIQNSSNAEKQAMANHVLGHMVNSGVVFSEKRLTEFVANLQSFPGDNPIAAITENVLSPEANLRIYKKQQDAGHTKQRFEPLFR